jgi:hypothetical protein
LALATEYIFDYFLMAYINGLRSFGHKSRLAAMRQKSKKRESTEKWEGALDKAERALLLCREAARLGTEKRFEEAEESARRGINELKERLVFYSLFLTRHLIADEYCGSVVIAPKLMGNDISELWDEESMIAA